MRGSSGRKVSKVTPKFIGLINTNMEQDNISLQYGMYRTPSLGNDGELSECVNLIPKAGELVNIQEPRTVTRVSGSSTVDVVLNSGDLLLCIHHINALRKDIYVIGTSNSVEYINEGTRSTLISDITEDVKSVISIGNTLIIQFDSQTLYYLWRESSYISLGNHIPELHLKFAIEQYHDGLLETDSLGYHTSAEYTDSHTDQQGEALLIHDEDRRNFTTAIMASVNKLWAERRTNGAFCFPFFVRYALRLYDGTFANVSSPILIVPNDKGQPMIWRVATQTSGSSGGVNARARICMPGVRLMMRVDDHDSTTEDFSAWSDIIRNVSVFVSNEEICFNPSLYSFSEFERAVSEPETIIGYFQRTIPVAGQDPTIQYPADYETPSDMMGLIIDSEYSRLISLGTSGRGVSEYRDKLKNESNFFLLEEVNIDAIPDNAYHRFYSDTTGIAAKEAITDDFYGHDKLVPYSMFGYNNRLHFVGVKRYFATNRPLQDFLQEGFSGDEITSAKVILNYDGTRYEIPLSPSVYLPDTERLRYFFYPDTHAEYLEIEVNSNTYQYQLDKHALLNGAIFSRDTACGNDYYVPGESIDFSDAIQNGYLAEPNKVLVSGESNPWIINYSNAVTLTGEINALATTAKALSQGQFGEFPVYAFCSDGIWALTVSDTGTYTAKQPVSRDVCTNPASITQIDDAVVFVTNQGLKLIQGSDVVLLSEAIEGFNVSETSVDISTTVSNFIGRYVTDRTPLVITDTAQFVDQVQTAKIVYDYPHQLLHIFPEPSAQATSYKHYVYSLDTKQWSTQVLSSDMGQLITAVPGYPLSTMQFGNKLYQYQKLSNNTLRAGYALTRPLSLGDPLTRKSLYDLRVFGQRTLTDTIRRVAVYVSNDNVNWYQLKSLKAMSAKYYRFLVMTYQCDIDTVSGLALQYDYRYNHKMRSTEN